MARHLGIDHGTKRIGIAISDPDGRIVSPERVLTSRGSPAADADAILAVADELDAAEIVVGLPVHMDGTESDQTKRTRAFIDALRKRTPRKVHAWDERLSSAAADEMLAERGLTRKKKMMRQDATAAAVILTEYLKRRMTNEERGTRN